MATTLIRNVKTLPEILGRQGDELIPCEVLIDAGKIISLSEMIMAKADEVIDGRGGFLSPGLVDPQVHFREPGMEYKEDIESGSKTAAKGGFTCVISMPNTNPTADNFETVAYMKHKALELGLCRVYPTGAVTFGLKGEKLTDFKELKEAGAIALTDDGKGIQNDELMLEAFKKAKEVDLPILDHSEDETLSNGGAIHKGKVSEKYEVKGIDSMSEAVHVKRGCEFSKKTGAHYHVLHVSTKASIEYIREAKKEGANVTVEASPHHLLLCDEDIKEVSPGKLDANYKMNPPLRSKEDREACVEAFLDGTIDAVATDHAPHAPHEKAQDIEHAPFGIIGLETAFPLLYTYFVRTKKMPLRRLVYLMSEGGAKLFKLPYGKLKEGGPADFAIFDLESPWTVSVNDFVSKSSNSPFIGETLFGKTLMTMLEGKLVYEDKK